MYSPIVPSPTDQVSAVYARVFVDRSAPSNESKPGGEAAARMSRRAGL